MSATVIAFANQKGGVAKKTTSSIQTAASWFANKGHKTLIIDLDGQGHVAQGIGLEKSDGLYDWVVNEKPIENVVVQARENLDVVPNSDKTVYVSKKIREIQFDKQYYFHELLEAPRSQYDYIFLDTAPSKDELHTLALIATDMLVIPANMEYFALDGIEYILRTLQSISKIRDVTPPYLIGVLPTMFDVSTRITTENVKNIEAAVGIDKVLPPIPHDVKIRECISRGQTIWEYDPNCRGAIGYEKGLLGKRVNSLGRQGGYLHLCEIIESLVELGG
jgi:chromosome partitioning protein